MPSCCLKIKEEVYLISFWSYVLGCVVSFELRVRQVRRREKTLFFRSTRCCVQWRAQLRKSPPLVACISPVEVPSLSKMYFMIRVSACCFTEAPTQAMSPRKITVRV